MALDSHRLNRIVWGAGPAALYLGIEAAEEWQRGAIWTGLGLVTLALLVVVGALMAPPGVLRSRNALVYLALLAVGIVGWTTSAQPLVRILSFAWVVVVQVGVLLLARRSVLDLKPVEGDSPVALGLHNR